MSKLPIKSDKVVKYAKARSKGLTKKESLLVAGYSPTTLPIHVESTDTYKAISIKSALLAQISLDELAKEHLKNVVQDEDKGAKNKAIEMAYQRIEPEAKVMEDEEKVVVILKG